MTNSSESRDGRRGHLFSRRVAAAGLGASLLAPKAFAANPSEQISQEEVQKLVEEIDADPLTGQLLDDFLKQAASLPEVSLASLEGAFDFSPISPSDLINAGTAAVLAIPIDAALGRLPARGDITVKHLSAVQPQEAPFPYTDTMYPSTNMRVVGLAHHRKEFMEHGRHLLDAIDESDIVLLEEGRRFFGTLAEYAKSKNKEVYYIDYRRSLMIFIATFATLLVLGLISKKRNEQNSLVNPIEIARKLLAFPINRGSYASLFADVFRIGLGTPTHKMKSFIVDGRTVGMLRNALEIAQKDPTKKACALIGDTHAKGFLAYADHPDLYALKRAFYNICYLGALAKARKAK